MGKSRSIIKAVAGKPEGHGGCRVKTITGPGSGYMPCQADPDGPGITGGNWR